jgi:large subunit ribosomal protein L15
MKLNELRDNPGAAKKQKRVGRGPGSGKGKTAGRGIKGQTSRSGVAIGGYEGGQMPLYRRLPKRGFTKPNRKAFAVINLGIIQKFIDAKKIDAKAEITEDVLLASGAIRRKLDGVRVLAKGEITSKVTLAVTGASQAAIDAVAKAGGTLTVATAAAAEYVVVGSRRAAYMHPRFSKRRRPGNRIGGAFMKERVHGFRSRTNGGEPQLGHAGQGDRASSAYPVHDRPVDGLPPGHLHPGAGH